MKSPLLQQFTKMPSSIRAADRDRLTAAALAAYNTKVKPAYQKLHDYLEETYVPGARESIAISALPNGAAWYAYNVHMQTTPPAPPRRSTTRGSRR